MADLLRDRKGKAALVALILLALSLASTVAMQPGGRSPDSRSPVGHTGLRPDWVRLPPSASPAPPPTAVQPAPAAPTERPLPAPTPLEPPPPTVEAPVPTETITIAGVSTPVEAPPSATAAPPVESPAPPTQSPSPPPAPVVTEGLDLAFAAAIVELANQARLANGLTPLAEHPALVAAAQEYADVHAHVSPDRLDHNLNGSTLDSRAEAEGYAGWTFLAENLVWGSVEPSLSPAEAVQLWLDSPAHRNNMLSPTINETGVGCYVSAAEPPFRICVQDFGARP
ncbi:MAG: hypothetical protein A2Z17_03320 [Gammaproteobacteria bacterium RBG_16_66_13]|nr:MAG: hypothetical protein A2Z17_03320 [Gammaproteobacteria bacterium RBG_16_66_13]